MKKQAMQYIKNITTAGMKGRKKETKLNKIILTMVFFLFAGVVIVLSSFLKTQKEFVC